MDAWIVTAPARAAPVVSFVVPVLNDADRLRRCLRSIARSAPAPDMVEVIVADNGSTDDSADVARAEGAVVLSLPGLRLGELRNRAAAAARGGILAFVDADHEIVPEWIPAVLDGMAGPHVGGVGAPCHPPSPATWVQRAYSGLRRHPHDPTPVEWLGGGNLAVRRADFLAAGGFDTTLETCEDVDLCRRLRARGLQLVSDARLRNVHHGDPRTLRQVFSGELWRGRDNVRVSLRAPRSWRTLASAAVPLANLCAMAAAVVGAASLTPAGWAVAAGAAGYLLTIVALRATMMVRSSRTGRRGTDRLRRRLRRVRRSLAKAEVPRYDWFSAVAVAAAYEAGRALALVARAGHRHRRRASEPARSAA